MFLKRKEKERKGKRKRERWKEKDETGLNEIRENVWGRLDLKGEEEDFPSPQWLRTCLPWHREIPHALEQQSLCNTTTEPALRASSAQLESGPHLPQLDRVCMKQ